MLARLLIIIATVVPLLAIPKASVKEELKRLAHLPTIQFAPLLHFDRQAGFVLYPSPEVLRAEIERLEKELKKSPEDFQLTFRIGRLCDLQQNPALALRFYHQAMALSRQKLAVEPADLDALTTLGDGLVTMLRFSEAESHLQKAISVNPESPAAWISMGNCLKEQAWFALVGQEQVLSTSSFIHLLEEVVETRTEKNRTEDTRKYLQRAADCFDKAVLLDSTNSAAYLARSVFRSFYVAMNTALSGREGDNTTERDLERKVFSQNAIDDLLRASELAPRSPELLALASLVPSVASIQENHLSINLLNKNLTSLPLGASSLTRDKLVALQELGESNDPAVSSPAWEFAGTIQLLAFGDVDGAQLSFQRAIASDATRERAWDLLTLGLVQAGEFDDLVESLSIRLETAPTSRNQLLLARAYERAGNVEKAQWSAVSALAANKNDFLANLAVANMIFKHPDESLLPRALDCIKRAEKHLGSFPTQQNYVDLALTRAIYFGLTDQPEQARTVLKEMQETANSPEIEAALLAIGY